MKEYLKDLIPRVKKFSSKLDILTLLVSKNWVLVNNNIPIKKVFIFRRNNQLLISENGAVNIGQWEHLNSGALLLFFQNTKLLFSHGFVDDNVLVLKLDGTNIFYLFEKEENVGLVNTKQFLKPDINISSSKNNSYSNNLK